MRAVRRHLTRSKLRHGGSSRQLEYRTNEQVAARARQIAPVSDDDIEQLILLVDGIREYADMMERLIPPLGGEIDVTRMSRNMEGDR